MVSRYGVPILRVNNYGIQKFECPFDYLVIICARNVCMYRE